MKECKICIMNDTVEEFQLLKNDTCNFCYQFIKDRKKAFTLSHNKTDRKDKNSGTCGFRTRVHPSMRSVIYAYTSEKK